MSVERPGHDLLVTAGWSENRNIDPSPAVTALKSAGYPFWTELEEFLRQYSELAIVFVRNDRPDSLWFDARRAANMTTPDAVRSYEAEFGTSLAPIGFAYHDHLLLLAGKDGRFFGVYDDFTANLGTSAEDVLDQVTNNKVKSSRDG